MQQPQLLKQPEPPRQVRQVQARQPRSPGSGIPAQGVEPDAVREHAGKHTRHARQFERRGSVQGRPPAAAGRPGRGVQGDSGAHVEQRGADHNVARGAVPLAAAEDEQMERVPGQEGKEVIHHGRGVSERKRSFAVRRRGRWRVEETYFATMLAFIAAHCSRVWQQGRCIGGR